MENISLKLFKIDEQELLNIWDNFTDMMIEDKEETSAEILQFLTETVIELSSGHAVELINIDERITQLFQQFILAFTFDEESKMYEFQYMFQFAKGKYRSIE